MRWARSWVAVSLALVLGCTVEGPRDVDDDDGDASSSQSAGGASTSASTSSAGGATTSSGPGMCDGGPLSAPLPGCTPTPLPSTGDFQQDCVDRINQFRWECQCLPPLARWTEAESCTDSQSAADQQIPNQKHPNFGMCNENAQNTCPNWGSEDQILGGCLQMMWDEGPGEPFEAHGHYLNMSSTTYTKVACGISVGQGGVWSNQNFSQ